MPVPLPPPSPAPHALPEPALGKKSMAHLVLVPAKLRAQEAKSQHCHGPARTTHRWHWGCWTGTWRVLGLTVACAVLATDTWMSLLAFEA